ncbi:DsbA family protein [Haliscomenobacter sp.]|uniref:DsbA family protein n=1 Tax=Haliscomenobacter sp. TaxID=2717303 RepID=UPI0033651208
MNIDYSNPLLCDLETGVCKNPTVPSADNNFSLPEQRKTLTVNYFTDPICSSCWGIEPQLRKFKLEYGHSINIAYRMGGLLPDWTYNKRGISKPKDVAQHWDEVSQYYDMPIDGDVWLEDPLNSSYPPSVAFKAAQIQDEAKAIKFLRRIREMVFVEKKNITKWNHLAQAATESGLDAEKLKTDYETQGEARFHFDLALTQKLGVSSFPTFIFTENNQHQAIVGFKPYRIFEETLLKICPQAPKMTYDKSWVGLFNAYPTLTTREFAELSGTPKPESEMLLQNLADEFKLTKTSTKNGVLWSIK